MENTDVAQVLGEIADLMELTGGNSFKVRAYRQAAQVVDTLSTPVAELIAAGTLGELPAIGEHMVGHIAEILEKGTCLEHEQLRAKVPPGLPELLAVEGVGPKTVAAVWHALGITNLDAFEQAAREGRLVGVGRLGKKRIEGVLAAIVRHRARKGRFLLHRALPYADSMIAALRKVPGVKRADAAGSLRRRKETVGDLDLLVASVDPERALEAFTKLPEVASVLARGPTKSSVRLSVGLQVDLRVVGPECWGAALHYFTGSKSHNIAIRTRAVKRGIKLSEYGVFDREDHRLSGETEEQVFAAVGLPWIPPELRENTGEIEAAEQGRLPKLIEEADLLGDLHVHSRASQDARNDLEELALEARRLGRRYLAITDHSRSRPLGLDEAGLAAQARQVCELDRRFLGRPHLLSGIEVDILEDGALDLPDEALAGVDCVVASVHSHFDQDIQTMTARMVRAIRSRQVHVVGHPSGRQIGKRDACALELEQVLAAAREEGVALEINAMPERLDLSETACRAAKDAGVGLVISSDAHITAHLSNLRYGVWAARRGWVEAKDVLNTLPLAELKRRLEHRQAKPRRAAR